MSEISLDSNARNWVIKSAKNGKFVRAHKGKENKLMAISKNIGDQERFRLIELEGCSKVAFEAYNNSYVSVGEGFELVANQDHIKESETFSLINGSGDIKFIFFLKTEKFVTMNFGGDEHLKATANEGLGWEEFIIGKVDDASNWKPHKIEP